VNKVLIIQAEMIQYRVPFFTKLHSALKEDGIDLTVAYSNPRSKTGKNDNCELLQAPGAKVQGYWVLGGRALYQPLLREVAAADLVIAQEANRLLLNYLLAVLSKFGMKRVAFWGYGENKDAKPSDFSELLRRRLAHEVDWYFAYTRGAAKNLASRGLPAETITTVGNAIDTRKLAELIEGIGQDELSLKKREFSIEENACIGLFCGVLHPDKGIGFLLEAAQAIRAKLPRFHLIVMGGGPEEEKVRTMSKKWPWIHGVGPRFGIEKAIFFKLADVFLLPGYVGLAILDSFAAGLPLLTTDIPYHRPEIEYLDPGSNGLMTEHDVEKYAAEIVSLFSNPALLRKLSDGALATARRYSIDTMVENFRVGVLAFLEMSRKASRDLPG
jgi:glycosyltransferase involved in cell wall biosynthesis